MISLSMSLCLSLLHARAHTQVSAAGILYSFLWLQSLSYLACWFHLFHHAKQKKTIKQNYEALMSSPVLAQQ